MASTNQSLMTQQDEGEDNYHGDHHLQQQHHHHLQSMSRLSLCSQDHDHGSGGTGSNMSLLSIENFDADEEVSDREAGKELLGRGLLSSDSEKEAGCYSLPATPPRRRRRMMSTKLQVNKDYASDNELILLGQSGATRSRTRRRRSVGKDAWPPVERPSDKMETKKKKEETFGGNSYLTSSAGESDHSGVMVITRPKGGRRSLCMDLDEVKACNELGFELEHEHIMPCVSVGSGHDFDTSSGNNSPIANWRISSPGDDPRDVKARLKVWAQAVALASTSRKGLDLYS